MTRSTDARAARTPVRHAMLAAALCLGAAAAAAQSDGADWPREPIQMVVGYSAGGSTDTLARRIADAAGRALGQQIIVVNRPGAGGTMGMAYVSRAKPDGYTIGIGSSATHATSLLSLPTQPYHPVRNFVPITKLVDYHNVLVANPARPFKDMAGLLAYAREKNGGAVFGSAGPGSTNQLAMEIVLRNFGVSMIHAPYKGSGPALMDVIGGHIDMMFDITNTTLPHIKSGAVVPIAIASPQRNAQLPDVPTLGEVGVKVDNEDIYNLWIGLFGPQGMPDAIRDKIDRAFQQAMVQDDIVQAMQEMGLRVSLAGPDAFSAIVARDYAFWGDFIRQSQPSQK